MKTETRKVLALNTLTATAAAFETAILEFRDAFELKQTDKQDANRAAAAVKQMRTIVQRSKNLTASESKVMKKETYASGAAVYEFLQIISLIPDDKVEDLISIVERLTNELSAAIPE